MRKSVWTKQPFVIAEVAQGYEGSAKLVDLFVRSAASCGADAVKFQIFFANELALPDYQHYGLFKQLELSFDIWAQALGKAHQSGLLFYSDVFGLASLAEMERIGVDGYKIHATDITNKLLLKAVAATHKSVLVSAGGSGPDEIAIALEVLSGCDVALMYGFQAEPTATDANNLRRLQTIKDRFKKPVGFQDHTAGDADLAFYVSAAAMGAGADIIEKHLTLSREARLEDSVSALTAEEFVKWAGLMRECYQALGKAEWELSAGELEYRRKVNRAVCAAREIAVGGAIGEADLMLRRTDRPGLYEIDQVVGRTAKAAIKAGTMITEDDLL